MPARVTLRGSSCALQLILAVLLVTGATIGRAHGLDDPCGLNIDGTGRSSHATDVQQQGVLRARVRSGLLASTLLTA